MLSFSGWAPVFHSTSRSIGTACVRAAGWLVTPAATMICRWPSTAAWALNPYTNPLLLLSRSTRESGPVRFATARDFGTAVAVSAITGSLPGSQSSSEGGSNKPCSGRYSRKNLLMHPTLTGTHPLTNNPFSPLPNYTYSRQTLKRCPYSSKPGTEGNIREFMKRPD